MHEYVVHEYSICMRVCLHNYGAICVEINLYEYVTAYQLQLLPLLDRTVAQWCLYTRIYESVRVRWCGYIVHTCACTPAGTTVTMAV